jgi:hypothetical protein
VKTTGCLNFLTSAPPETTPATGTSSFVATR